MSKEENLLELEKNRSKRFTVEDMHGKDIPVWVFDFESYYEANRKRYSLSNPDLTTTLYVRDSRFWAHGCSFVDPDGFSFWVTHNDLPAFFASVDWGKVCLIGQNNYFDALIAHEHYGVVAGMYGDTMSMSYGLWGSRVSGSLAAICERLELEGKIKGSLEKTSGIRKLPISIEAGLVPYAIQDAEQTRDAAWLMYYQHGYPNDEMRLIDITIRAFAVPVLNINRSLLDAEIEQEAIRFKALLNSDIIKSHTLSPRCAKLYKTGGVAGLMRSRPCFAELLKSRGIVPPMKMSTDTKTKQPKYNEDGSPVMTYAFAKTDIELLNLLNDPRVSDLVTVWTGLKSTIRGARAERLLLHSDYGTKPLPVPLKYCGPHTFRWAGWDDINLQNLPSGKDGRGKRHRLSLTAPAGYKLGVVDASQIECRVNAWLWGQNDLLELFATGGDPYATLASEMYKVAVVKGGENGHLRATGKAMVLGLGFGMGWKRFLHGCLSGSITGDIIEMTEEGAIEAVNFWRQKNSRIVQGWNELRGVLDMMCGKAIPKEGHKVGPMTFFNTKVKMPNDLRMHYNNVHYHEFEDPETRRKMREIIYQTSTTRAGEAIWQRIWHSKLDENLVQALARIIVASQAIEIAKRYRIVLLVHDEVVYLIPENEANEGLEFGLNALRVPPLWCEDIPLEAEGGYDDNYSK